MTALPAPAAGTHRAPYGRWFAWTLAALAVVALAIRVHIGSLEYMDFDEWQQVFMASAPRWKDLAYELNAEAHPPAFYLLLKALLWFGHGKLLYRCIGILPGTASVVLIGIIARRLLRSPAAALLCAAALALSTAAITISIEVRQYQLAVFLVLIAFNAFLTMWSANAALRDRDYVVFGLSATLAVLCHYSAIVFLGACIVVAAGRQALESNWGRRQGWRLPAALAAPLALFAYLYFTHARRLPMLGYLYDFYWRPTTGETLAGYLARNLQNFWNLFAPVESANRALVLSLAASLGVLAAAILTRTRPIDRSDRPDRALLPIYLAGVMTLELAGLSIARAYPFGGLLRHQYIVGPFLILGAFVVIDRLASLLGRRAKVALLAATAILAIANLTIRWPRLVVFPNAVAYTAQFDAYRAAFPDARAVYVDHWGVIGYFIHTDNQPRRFVRRIDDVFAIDQYHIDAPPAGVEIFYDKTRYVLDFRHASLYRSLARCLRQSGVAELTLFFFTPGDAPLADSAETLRRIITDTAAEQGLTVTKIVFSRTTIFAGFELRRP